MITGTIIGDREVIATLNGLPDKLRASVRATTQRLGFALQAKVQREKLTGQVLKVRTGRLRSSINPREAIGGDSRSRYAESGDVFEYYVGTNVVYAAIHEYGGTIKHPGGTAYFMRPNGLMQFVSNKSSMAWLLPRTKAHAIKMPARPFLAPALAEFKPTILREFEKALRETVKTELAK